MFFARPGEYEPCGMFTWGHALLLSITIICITIGLRFSRKCNHEQVKKIITIATIVLWIVEIIKIIFNLSVGLVNEPNHYVPLYYCSIILYAGIFSSFGKGTLKKVGDIFIAVGAVIGGAFFLSCPNTSIAMYPLWHYLSIQSFFFHGTMVYLGLLVHITSYVDLKLSDIKYYVAIIVVMLVISYFANKALDTNFMFISKDFPGTPVSVIYNFTGKLYTIVMCVLHMTLPFFLVYPFRRLVVKVSERKSA